jgi:uridine kinase
MTPSGHITDVQGVIAMLAKTAGTDGVTLVGVCGHAGAGKTTLCNRITEILPDFAVRLDCDRFSAFSHPERGRRIERALASGDPVLAEAEENPRNWYDWEAISLALQSLQETRTFEWDRAWNGENGLLDARYRISLPASGPALVLCDCIYLLHDPVRRWFDLTLLVQASAASVDERRRRRAGDRADLAKARRDRFERPYFEQLGFRADRIVELQGEP